MPHQKFESATIKPRYSKGAISSFGSNSVYPRIPWVAAWWSFTFPGFGHMFLGKHLHGFMLIIWGIVVNTQANLNLGIALSMLGKFEEAKDVINEDWILLYMAVYIYSIWDSYRSAVEINKSHILSEVEDAPMTPSVINFLDVVLLEKKKPILGAVWSFLTPGLGQLYGGATAVGTFVLAWWIFVTYKAGTIGAWFYSFIGDFSTASANVDWQWFLFLPSMYAFAIYQAYSSVVANNALYDIEQIRFLRVRDERLTLQRQNKMNDGTVQIVATFEHSPFVEMFIHDIETIGVPSENIVALPLENLESQTQIIDSLHRVDGRSVLDGAMVSATIIMLLGTIYGFVWKWGPVIWGLIGLVGGFSLGLIIELVLQKKKIKVFESGKSEVFMQVTCPASMQKHLIKVLRARKAKGYLVLPQRITPDT
ncbi:hypothetical protein SM124_11770 [Bacillus sp. 31A1R]|uniref:Uncharacterized protein n=1 Tax=Robertmurraya mangrovi TaxID=3098077 RepID=A0ABU5IZ85_9BACI|nr:hypothetical protein [Bacillus sp. 31A1R]MDZ5472426.1 hypothetical protein [Bacillus sp. 31A1R]